MLKKILLFLSISVLCFASSEEALKNALDRFYSNKNNVNLDVRTAQALFQPEEKIVTIQYNGEDKSGYTSEIAVGEEYSCKITLFPGYSYVIVGAGDNSVNDVDIFVYDSLDNTVAFDRTSDSTAYAVLPKNFKLNAGVNIDKSIAGTEFSVRPYVKEKYTVKIKLRDGKSPKSFVAFFVATQRIK